MASRAPAVSTSGISKVALGIGSSSICILGEHCLLEDKHMQQIVSEFANIYSVRCSTQTNTPSKEVTLKFSRMYRSVIQATLIDEDEDGNVKAELCDENTKAFLSSVDLAWGLAEAIFFTKSSSLLMPLLVDWVQQHSSLDPESFKDALHTDPNDRDFWNVLFKVLLQGFLAEAISLLAVLIQHYYGQNGVSAPVDAISCSHLDHTSTAGGNTQAQLVQDIITLLKQSPLVKAAQYSSTYEFRNYSAMWRNSFKELKVLAEACDDEMLTKLCGLCSGDKSVLNSFLKDKHIGTWYEGVVTYCLYIVPEVNRSELREIVMGMIPASSLTKSIDKLLFAFFSGDNLEISFLICSVFPDYCTALHLVDLFFFSGLKLNDKKLKKGDNSERSDILQCLVMDYGRKLISHETLWPYAFMYLCQLDAPEKHEIIDELIDKIEINSDQKAVDLIEVCTAEGFVNKVSDINYQRACFHLKSESLPEASVWAVRARASDIATQVAFKSVKDFWQNRDFEKFSNVFSKLLMFSQFAEKSIRDDTSLTMLTNYYIFQSYCKQNDMGNAFEVLKNLVGAPLCWEELKKNLYYDSVTFIENGFLEDLDAKNYGARKFFKSLGLVVPPVGSADEDHDEDNEEKMEYMARIVRDSYM